MTDANSSNPSVENYAKRMVQQIDQLEYCNRDDPAFGIWRPAIGGSIFDLPASRISQFHRPFASGDNLPRR